MRHAAHDHPGQMSQADLIDLLARVSENDNSAFEALYAATSAKLYAVIVRIVRQHELAEDVMQNTYLRIWMRASQYSQTRGSPVAWMAIIARNLALDQIRQKPMSSIESHARVAEMAGSDNPLQTVERNDSRRHLLSCIERLAPEKRDVVLLAYFHGLTGEEISVRIGRPVSTVKTFLRRSLMQLEAMQANGGLSQA